MAWQPLYATPDELKAYVRVDDDVDDVQVSLALAGASRAIDKASRRQFGKTDTALPRVFTAQWDPFNGTWYLDVDDLMTAAGLTIATPLGTVDSFRFESANAVSKGMPWTRIVVKTDSTFKPDGCEDNVTITATWGWTDVPAAIKQATLIQAARILVRRDSPFGVAGSPDLGNEMRLLAKVDPDVAVLVAAYRRQGRPA